MDQLIAFLSYSTLLSSVFVLKEGTTGGENPMTSEGFCGP